MTQHEDEVDAFEADAFDKDSLDPKRRATAYLDEDVDDFDPLDESDDDDDDEDLDDDSEDDSDDDDDSEDDDDEDYDDLDDDLEDATDEEIDLVVAIYREDGAPVAVPMAKDLANDLDELMTQLRRLPGDAGALGLVSINGEFFVLCRVRGRNVQVLLNDSIAANDWPIARDVMDYLGEDVPDPDDDSETVGDLGLLADQGVSEFEMEALADDLDEDSDELLRRLVKKLHMAGPYEKALASQGKAR